MCDWRIATEEEKSRLLAEEKERRAEIKMVKLLVAFIFAVLFLFVGMVYYMLFTNEKLYDILGYSASNPPEFRKFHYGFVYADETYEQEEIEYYELQEQEIASARQQVKKELLPGTVIYYILTMGGTIAVVTHSFVSDKREYEVFRNGAYVVCEGKCIDKRIKKEHRILGRGYVITYFMLVELEDGSNQEVEVYGTVFENAKLGSPLLLVHFRKEQEKDKIDRVYLRKT